MADLTDAQKKAALALIQPQLDALINSAYAIYAAALAAGTVVTPPATGTGSTGTTTPNSSLPITATLQAVTATGVTVAPDSGYAKGQLISFSNGRTTTITGVATGTSSLLTTSEPPDDSDKARAALVGTKATVMAAGGAAVVTPPATSTPSTGTTTPSTGTSTPATGVSTTLGLIGLNLGMGAGGDTVLPGISGQNYGYASDTEIQRAVGYGFKRFRIGGLWERFIKPGGQSALYTGAGSSLEEIKRVCRTCASLGASVLLEPFHNYGGYSSTGTSADRKQVGASGGPTPQLYANDLLAVLLAIKADAAAWAAVYGVDTMNEWQTIDNATVLAAHKAVLATVAPQIDKKVLVLENNNFSSTVNWVSAGADFSTLVDPRGTGMLEWSGHLYLDQQSSGYYDSTGDTVSAADAANGITTSNIGVRRIAPLQNAAAAAKVKLSIGETNVPGTCPNLLVGLINLLNNNRKAGIDSYIFGMSDWFGTNAHNIETPTNAPTLAAILAVLKSAA